MVTCACCDVDKPNTVALHCQPEIALCSDCLDWLVRKRDRQDSTRGSVRVVSHDPIFLVADVPRALDHYTKLGFRTESHDDTYAFAHRDDLVLHPVRLADPVGLTLRAKTGRFPSTMLGHSEP